jgi:hypothetical protein
MSAGIGLTLAERGGKFVVNKLFSKGSAYASGKILKHFHVSLM